MNTRRIQTRTVYLAIACAAILGACKEPSQPSTDVPAATAQPAAETASAPASTASATPRPVELNAVDRKVVLLPANLCNLERIGDTLLGSSQAYVASDASNLVAKGWVGDEASLAPPSSPFLMIRQIGGARVWQMPISVGVKRADVAKFKEAPALEGSGFSMPMDLSELPAGTYRMLIVYDRDGGRYACDNGRDLQLGG